MKIPGKLVAGAAFIAVAALAGAAAMNGAANPVPGESVAGEERAAVPSGSRAGAFAVEAVESLWDYSWLDHEKKIAAQADRFTETGRIDFMDALRNSGNLAFVEKEKLVVRGKAVSAPVIEGKGVGSSRNPLWFVSFDMDVTFHGPNATAVEKNTVKAIVTSGAGDTDFRIESLILGHREK